MRVVLWARACTESHVTLKCNSHKGKKLCFSIVWCRLLVLLGHTDTGDVQVRQSHCRQGSTTPHQPNAHTNPLTPTYQIHAQTPSPPTNQLTSARAVAPLSPTLQPVRNKRSRRHVTLLLLLVLLVLLLLLLLLLLMWLVLPIHEANSGPNINTNPPAFHTQTTTLINTHHSKLEQSTSRVTRHTSHVTHT